MKRSFWDNSIFKKYSSISHYRLLSQLLSELKAYPINRKKDSSSSNNDSSHVKTYKPTNNLKNNPDSQNLQKESTTLYSNINTIKNNDLSNVSNKSNEFEENTSFKDRLDDVDMR